MIYHLQKTMNNSMTKNDFILQAILQMASDRNNLHTDTICTVDQIKKIVETAKRLADIAETVAHFE